MSGGMDEDRVRRRDLYVSTKAPLQESWSMPRGWSGMSFLAATPIEKKRHTLGCFTLLNSDDWGVVLLRMPR